ncbi:MAG TPA: hydroxyacid dehydrogenase [Candidatus Eisenbacteria bacterium]
MAGPRVLVSDPLSPRAIAALRAVPEVSVREAAGLTEDQLLPLVDEIEAWIVRSGTRVTRRLLEGAPRLRWVARAGAGLDNIDVAAAKERGIVVLNIPGANSVAVAELTIGLLLGLLRQIPAADASLRRGAWEKSKFQGRELRGKTIGIVGLGRIGRAVAQRARAFEMTCLACDPLVSLEDARAAGVELLPLAEVLPRADILTLHVPLTPETRGLLGAAEIARMRRGAVLVNAARGGLVDESALHAALVSGALSGAALDVFAVEPPGASPLLSLPNVVATPHLGATTVEAQDAVGEEIVRLLLAAMRQAGAVSG